MKRYLRGKLVKSWPNVPVKEKPLWKDEFSNGCSLVPDVPETVHCCVIHDKAYYEAGGGAKGRAAADKAFLNCMKEAGWTWRAYVRYFGVRMFGWTFWYDK